MQVCMSISEPGRLLCSLRYCGAPLPKHIEIQQSSFDHYIYRYQGGVKQVHPNLLPVPTALLGGKCSFPIFPLQSVAFVSFYCFWYINGSPGKGENILFWHLLAILLSLLNLPVLCSSQFCGICNNFQLTTTKVFSKLSLMLFMGWKCQKITKAQRLLQNKICQKTIQVILTLNFRLETHLFNNLTLSEWGSG